METFTKDPKLADPALDVSDFFPVWTDAFKWNGTQYGLPFDSYAGLLYNNRCMLKDAGFSSPPKTWLELRDKYGAKLTDKSKGTFAYAIQSLRGETQTADSFSRFLWVSAANGMTPKRISRSSTRRAPSRACSSASRSIRTCRPGSSATTTRRSSS